MIILIFTNVTIINRRLLWGPLDECAENA